MNRNLGKPVFKLNVVYGGDKKQTRGDITIHPFGL